MFNKGDKINVYSKESGLLFAKNAVVMGTVLRDEDPEDMDFGWDVYVEANNRQGFDRYNENRYSFELVEDARYAIPASRPFEILTWNEFSHAWEINGTMEEYEAYVARNTLTVESAPRELRAFEKILAAAKFSTVAEIAQEAIERADKIRELEKQATEYANKFAALQWQTQIVDKEISPVQAEQILNNRAFNNAYEAELRRLIKEAGL